MKLSIALRLTALIVLLTSFSDYWAYDRWDPTAPMNSSGPEAIAALNLKGPSTASVQCADLPDDNCVCCSPLMAPPAPVIPQPVLNLQSANELPHAIVIVSLASNTLITASPPPQEPTSFDGPLRT